MTVALNLTAIRCVYASPTLSLNSTGEYVIILQEKLKNIGYEISVDGKFDIKTKSAVEKFQRDNNLEPTGIVNNATWRALKENDNPTDLKIPDIPKKDVQSSKIQKNNSKPLEVQKLTAEEIKELQQKLKDLGYKMTMIDGDFGNETKAAVQAFQRDNNIKTTGIADNETLKALKKAKISKSETKTPKRDIQKYELTAEEVKELQQKLKDLGYKMTMIDGDFGNETKTAIQDFQKDNDIEATGIANSETLKALKKAKTSKSDTKKHELTAEEVRDLQQRLKDLGYKITMIDGEFGNETKSALQAFQEDYDLEITGVADKSTLKALKSEKLVKINSKSQSDEIKLNKDEVTILQKTLKSLGYKITMIDGEFGNETRAAIEAFQKDHKFEVTGVVNKSMLKLLKSEKLVKIDSKNHSNEIKLSKEEITILQKKLKGLGYKITMIDGDFGSETKSAVEAFQRDNKLEVTGTVNNDTSKALQKAKSLKVDPTDNKLVPFGKILISKSQAEAIVKTAKKYIGVPYVFGGTTPSGFDCSGFLQYVFKENGITIPRLADEQYKLGKHVKTTELVAGDLVFFTTYEAGASHCGIYLGNGQFVHTSSSRGVRIDLLSNIYWAPRFFGAKKIVEI